jgi:CubicO group peptidase (beta-lactamase class C family)
VPALDEIFSWPGETPAAAVTDANATIASAGAINQPQPWASVTKLVTAYCILELAENGDLDLDEPAGPPGSTIRHLLSHAAGVGYADGAPIVLAPPGRRRIYSNAAFDILGELAAVRGQQPFAEQVANSIFEPLGMSATSIEGPASSGAIGPVGDLVRFARELLAPTLISAETLAEATAVAYPGLDGVLPGFGRHNPNDWGLGFELKDSKEPHWTGHTNAPTTFGHFGQSGSFLWVDPEVGLACVALTGVPFGPWAASAWPAFSDHVIAEFGAG